MQKLFLQKCFRERAFFRADDRADADVVPREPAVAGFQNELDVVRRGDDWIRVVHFEVMNFLDHAIGTDVGGGNGFGTVFHPERRALRNRQNKKHRVRVLNVRAEHHAGHLLFFREREFGVQSFRAEINFHRRQFRLRLRGQRIFRGRRRGGGFSFFAAGQKCRQQEQREKFCQFHETSLPEAAGIFNQTELSGAPTRNRTGIRGLEIRCSIHLSYGSNMIK